MKKDRPKRVLREPEPFEFEVKWRWVTGAALAGILASPSAATASGHSEPHDTDPNDIDVASILSKAIDWVVKVDESGNMVAIVGSPLTGSIDPEMMRMALLKLGATVRSMTAFEAVSKPWTTVTAREPWAAVVQAALAAMGDMVEEGAVLTERHALGGSVRKANWTRIKPPF